MDAVVEVHRADVVLPVADAAGRPAAPIDDGAVAVRDGLVVAVGRHRGVIDALGGAPVRETVWSGALVPGLVNAHTHLQYTGYGDMAGTGLPFPAWIAEMMRRRQTTTDADWAEAAAAGAAALLASGTTAVADVVTDQAAVAPVGASGLRGVSFLEMLGWSEGTWHPDGRRELEARVQEAQEAGHEVGLMPHAPYTLDVAVIADILGEARARGLRAHTHLAESPAETEYVRTGTGRLADGARAAGWDFSLVRDGGCGRTPAGLLDHLGVLDDGLHVAHAVHCDADDRAAMRRAGVVAALCPRSNAILEAGEAPIAAYLLEGSPIALGTDSLASSPSLDLLDEARAAAALARAQGYAETDLGARLLHAATAGGAAALGRRSAASGRPPLGALHEGAAADFAVFEAPVRDAATAADDVIASGRARATVLGGRLVAGSPG